MARFNRGDIIHLDFDPAAGKEMRFKHFALVVSPNEFHDLGMHIVCPISGGAAEAARAKGYLVSLMGYGLQTDGCIHVQHVKSLDLKARHATKVETAPDELVQEVIDKLGGLFL
jgi:mRNA interferase ChpB